MRPGRCAHKVPGISLNSGGLLCLACALGAIRSLGLHEQASQRERAREIADLLSKRKDQECDGVDRALAATIRGFSREILTSAGEELIYAVCGVCKDIPISLLALLDIGSSVGALGIPESRAVYLRITMLVSAGVGSFARSSKEFFDPEISVTSQHALLPETDLVVTSQGLSGDTVFVPRSASALAGSCCEPFDADITRLPARSSPQRIGVGAASGESSLSGCHLTCSVVSTVAAFAKAVASFVGARASMQESAGVGMSDSRRFYATQGGPWEGRLDSGQVGVSQLFSQSLSPRRGATQDLLHEVGEYGRVSHHPGSPRAAGDSVLPLSSARRFPSLHSLQQPAGAFSHSSVHAAMYLILYRAFRGVLSDSRNFPESDGLGHLQVCRACCTSMLSSVEVLSHALIVSMVGGLEGSSQPRGGSEASMAGLLTLLLWESSWLPVSLLLARSTEGDLSSVAASLSGTCGLEAARSSVPSWFPDRRIVYQGILSALEDLRSQTTFKSCAGLGLAFGGVSLPGERRLADLGSLVQESLTSAGLDRGDLGQVVFFALVLFLPFFGRVGPDPFSLSDSAAAIPLGPSPALFSEAERALFPPLSCAAALCGRALLGRPLERGVEVLSTLTVDPGLALFSFRCLLLCGERADPGAEGDEDYFYNSLKLRLRGLAPSLRRAFLLPVLWAGVLPAATQLHPRLWEGSNGLFDCAIEAIEAFAPFGDHTVPRSGDCFLDIRNDLTRCGLGALAVCLIGGCFPAPGEGAAACASRGLSRARLEGLVKPVRFLDPAPYVLDYLQRECRCAADSLLVLKALAPVLVSEGAFPDSWDSGEYSIGIGSSAKGRAGYGLNPAAEAARLVQRSQMSQVGQVGQTAQAGQAAPSVFSQEAGATSQHVSARVLSVAERAVSIFSGEWGPSSLGEILAFCRSVSGAAHERGYGPAGAAGLSPQSLRLALQVLLYSGVEFSMFDVLDALAVLVRTSPQPRERLEGAEKARHTRHVGQVALAGALPASEGSAGGGSALYAVVSQEPIYGDGVEPGGSTCVGGLGDSGDSGCGADQYNACLATLVARCFTAVCEQKLAARAVAPDKLRDAFCDPSGSGGVSAVFSGLLEDFCFLLCRIGSAEALASSYASPDFKACISLMAEVYGQSFPWSFVRTAEDWVSLLGRLYYASGASTGPHGILAFSVEEGRFGEAMHWILHESLAETPGAWLSSPSYQASAEMLAFLSERADSSFLGRVAAELGKSSRPWTEQQGSVRSIFLLAARRAGADVFSFFEPDALVEARRWIMAPGPALARICICCLGGAPCLRRESGAVATDLADSLTELAARLSAEVSDAETHADGLLPLAHLCRFLCDQEDRVNRGEGVYGGIVSAAEALLLCCGSGASHPGRPLLPEQLSFGDELGLLEASHRASLGAALGQGNILYSFPEVRAVASRARSLLAGSEAFRELESLGFQTYSLLRPNCDGNLATFPATWHLQMSSASTSSETARMLVPALVSALGCVLRACGGE